jgi:hypothetical protein
MLCTEAACPTLVFISLAAASAASLLMSLAAALAAALVPRMQALMVIDTCGCLGVVY